MAVPWILFCAVLFIATGKIYTQGSPKVTGSYKATGEMVEILEDDTGLLIQIAFEESFDADTQNAAFNVWVMGKNATYIENYKTNQTFRYVEGKDCQLMTNEEWIKTESPPSLLPYEDTKGIVRFSMKQLFSLDDKYLVENNISDEFRGIPARKWMHRIQGDQPNQGGKITVSIYSYWSDGSWNTTSNEPSVPLGFIINKLNYTKDQAGVKEHEQFINVYSFVPGAIHHQLFEPIQGMICENKQKTVPFPDVSNMQALAIHSEVVFPDYQQIKYVDTWFNPRSKLLRVDMERVKDEVPAFEKRSRKFQSEMVIGRMGIAFRLGHDKGITSCTVLPIKDFDLDIQNLINFKVDVKEWSIAKAFGLNQTAYTYIGKTSKRDIPCHLFQGVRKDWPEPTAKVESLWEWCFSQNVTTKDDQVIFRNGEYGLVNVQVTILKSNSSGDYPEEFRIFHHFYDVNLMDPDVMDASVFDIGACFRDNEKRHLQFVTDWEVTDDSLYLIENATSDLGFLQKWKTVIYQFSGLNSFSLRVSNVQSIVLNKKLYVKFTILGPHKDLPTDIKNLEKSSFDAENELRDGINDRKVLTYYRPNKAPKLLRIGVLPHSLEFQVNRTYNPHIPPSTTAQPISTSESIHFSLLTEPDDVTTSSKSPVTSSDKTLTNSTLTDSTSSKGSTGSTSKYTATATPTTPKPTKKVEEVPHKTRHQAGTVATVSIAMLLIGISIGGSGVFIKYNGLPSCLKCGRS